MNRYSRSRLIALLALVVSTSYFSAGCALSSRTALPELPPVPVFVITTTSVPQGFTGTPYPPPSGPSVALATSGGTPPLQACSIVNGILPTGLSITPSGSTCLISGTIADPGVVPPAVPDPSISCTDNGGNPAPPATATTCNYTFTVRAADSTGIADTQVYTMTVRVGFVLQVLNYLPGVDGRSYSAQIPASGGTQGSDLTNCTAMNLPPGLSIQVDQTIPSPRRACRIFGNVAGGASAGSPYMVSVTATDTAAGPDTQTITIPINPVLNVPLSFAMQDGTEGRPYTKKISVTGGNLPLTACNATGLPGGLGVAIDPMDNTACLITGTPNAGTAGNFNVTLRATDTAIAPPPAAGFGAQTVPAAVPPEGQVSAMLTINPPLAIPAFMLGNATEGQPFSQSIPSTGGQQPLTACAIAGQATGLTVAVDPGNTSNCLVSGTPAAGTSATSPYTVTITGTDSQRTDPAQGNALVSGSGMASGMSAQIVNPPFAIPAFVFGNGTEGRAFSQSIPSVGGNQPLTSCTATGLPTGLSSGVDPGNTSNCLVSGTPAGGSAGMYTVTLTIMDTLSAGNQSTAMSAPTALTINPPLTVPAFALANGTEGRTFTSSVPTMGGQQPLTACSATGLPAGLAIAVDGGNTSNCLISGSPAGGSAGPYVVTVTATDTATTSTPTAAPPEGVSAGTALLINPPLTFPAFTLNDGTEGLAYSQSVPTTGGQQPLTNCTATGLPGGLAVTVDPGNTSNCLLSGTPAAGSAGPYSVIFTARDTPTATTPTSAPPEGVSVASALTINASLTIPAFVFGNGTEARAFSQSIPSAGGNQPLTSCTATGLASGLVIGVDPGNTSNCRVSGTPAGGSAGGYSVVITAMDTPSGSTGASTAMSASTPLTINAPLMVPVFVLPNGMENRPYNFTVPTTGGNLPLTACSAPALPAGLVITPSGANCVISGSPISGTAAGSPFSIVVTATDTATTSTAAAVPPEGVSAASSLTILPDLTIPAFVFGSGVEGRAFSQSIPTMGGNPPLISCTAVGLPAGLAIAVDGGNPANCLVSGTPFLASAGNYNVTVSATDTAFNGVSTTAMQSAMLVINPPLTVPAFIFGNGTEGQAFLQSIPTTGGNQPLTACTDGATLPSGLIVVVDPGNTSNCLVIGTPAVGSAAGSPYSVTLTATDSNTTSTAQGMASSAPTTLTVNAPLAVVAFTLEDGTEGRAFTQTIMTTGGNQPLTSCTATGLPAGLVISTHPVIPTACLISGAPAGGSSAGSPYSVVVTVLDTPSGSTQGMAMSAATPLVINPPLTVPAFVFGNGVEGRAFSQSIPTAGGNQPLTACSAMGLPASLSIAPSGSNCVISGTPVPGDSTGSPYSVTITATDTATATTAAAAPPEGVSAATALVINPPLMIPAFTLGDGWENQAFSQSIPTTGGTGTLASCSAGATLPTGLVIAASGANCVISGTPAVGQAAGSPFSVDVTANDAATASTGAGSATNNGNALTIWPELTVNDVTLGDGVEGRAFSETVPTTGGNAAASLASCTMMNAPTGLTIGVDPGNNRNCLIGGTPASGSAGPYTITITANETPSTSTSASDSQLEAVNIFAPLTVPAFTFGAGVEGRAFSQSIPTTGGLQPLTNCTATGLPVSGSLTIAVDPGNTSNCLISGTPLAGDAGPYSVTITATDTASTSTAAATPPEGVSAATALNINAPLTIPAFTFGAGTENQLFSQSIPTTGGIQPLTNCTAVGLPPSLNIGVDPGNTSNCLVNGSPDAGQAASSPFSVDITATDTASTSTAAAVPPEGTSMANNLDIFLEFTIPVFTLGDGVEGRAFQEIIPTMGGDTSQDLVSCTAMGLPTGLSIEVDSTAVSPVRDCRIFGTPTVGMAAGSYLVTVTANDVVTASTAPTAVSGATTLDITTEIAFTPDPPVLGDGIEGATYSQTIVTTGGITPLTNCTAAVTDNLMNPVALATLGLQITASGSNCDLSDTGTGIAAGAAAGSPYMVVVSATDTASTSTAAATVMSTSATFNIAAPFAVNAFALENGTAGENFSFEVTTTGGVTGSPLTSCSLAGSTPSIPGGLTVAVGGATNRSCILSGPLNTGTAGAYTIQVTATDNNGGAMASDNQSSALTINAELSFGAADPLPTAVFARAYAFSLMPMGGEAPLTTSYPDGTPPAVSDTSAACTGLAGDSAGALSAALTDITTTGLCTFQARVDGTNTNTTVGAFFQTTYNVTVNPEITIGAQTLPAVLRNFPINPITFTASGGLGGYTFTISNTTAACGGLSITAGGVFSGTPTTAGTCTFDVNATDTANAAVASGMGTANFSFAVVANLAYVASPGTDSVTVINTETLARTADIDLSAITVGSFTTTADPNPMRVAVMGNAFFAYVTLQTDNAVAVVDLTNNSVVEIVDVSSGCTGPLGIAITPDNARAYVACTGGSVAVLTINTAGADTDDYIASVTGEPNGVAVRPSGDRVYVTRRTGNSLAIINNSGAVPSTFASFALPGANTNNPRGIAISLDGARAYIAKFDSDAGAGNVSGAVEVLNVSAATPTANSVFDQLGGDNATGFNVTLDPDGSRVFVTMPSTTANQQSWEVGVEGATPLFSSAGCGTAIANDGCQENITDGANNGRGQIIPPRVASPNRIFTALTGTANSDVLVEDDNVGFTNNTTINLSGAGTEAPEGMDFVRNPNFHIFTTVLHPGDNDFAYTAQLRTANATGAVSFTVDVAPVGPGCNDTAIDSTGLVTRSSDNTTGNCIFTITATDAGSGRTYTQVFTLFIVQ